MNYRPSAEVNIATVAYRPRSQAVLGPAPPWSPTKGSPPTQSQHQARHVLRCSARAAWGPHPKVPVAASELAGRASLALLASRTRHSAPESPACPTRALRAPAGEGHLRRRNLRAWPALPAPARALSNPPSAGPAPGRDEPPPPGDSPAPGLLAAPSTVHRLPARDPAPRVARAAGFDGKRVSGPFSTVARTRRPGWGDTGPHTGHP